MSFPLWSDASWERLGHPRSQFQKKLYNEIKVAQFSGYISEQTSYHHGEMSLQGAIVGLAQNYVGSNNIPLFMPVGQFGTRIQGGKDAAQPRYIFTKLDGLTDLIYNSKDFMNGTLIVYMLALFWIIKLTMIY